MPDGGRRFTHECVDITLDLGTSGAYVVWSGPGRRFHGYPRAVRTDNGPESTSRAFIAWTQQHDIEYLMIEPYGYWGRSGGCRLDRKNLLVDVATTPALVLKHAARNARI